MLLDNAYEIVLGAWLVWLLFVWFIIRLDRKKRSKDIEQRIIVNLDHKPIIKTVQRATKDGRIIINGPVPVDPVKDHYKNEVKTLRRLIIKLQKGHRRKKRLIARLRKERIDRRQAHARVREILDGIEHTEHESDRGFWETSVGAAFGFKIMAELSRLFMFPWEDLERDWPEDFHHENGNYLNRCSICDEEFMGHRRRVVCKVCSAPGKYNRGKNEI